MPAARPELRNRVTFRTPDTAVKAILYVALITPIGRLRLAATPTGLVRVELPGADAEAHMNVWLALHFPEASRRAGVNPILRKAAAQVEGYFTGRVTTFSVPLEPVGTPFQTAVWKCVTEIPFGITASYQDIARQIQSPSSVRAVGAAQAANPLPILVPCHRVIGTDGDLTGYAGGLVIKRWLLDHEHASIQPAAAKRPSTSRPATVIDQPERPKPFTLRRPTSGG